MCFFQTWPRRNAQQRSMNWSVQKERDDSSDVLQPGSMAADMWDSTSQWPNSRV